MNLDWLEPLTSSFPEVETPRKNYIDIAGYPRWENVNSNLLAFYFDDTEEHGFNRLFIDSLLDLVELKAKVELSREAFDTEFSVYREVSSRKGGRIDILISSSTDSIEEELELAEAATDWAIIIENKIDAELYNDLKDYWRSVLADEKIGVVLSVGEPKGFDAKNRAGNFVYISHKELMEKVIEKLPEYYMDSDDRHLLYLKDFINNTLSYYPSTINEKAMDDILRKYFAHSDEIKKFRQQEQKLLKYVEKEIRGMFRARGFEPLSAKKSTHYYLLKDKERLSPDLLKYQSELSKFRFYVPHSNLLNGKRFRFVFELYNKQNTSLAKGVLIYLEQQGVFSINEAVSKGHSGKVGGQYKHIFQIEFDIEEKPNERLLDALARGMDEAFFDRGFIAFAVEATNRAASFKSKQ